MFGSDSEDRCDGTVAVRGFVTRFPRTTDDAGKTIVILIIVTDTVGVLAVSDDERVSEGGGGEWCPAADESEAVDATNYCYDYTGGGTVSHTAQ